MLCINKDGNGDGTGDIEPDVLPLVGDYFIGNAPRLAERREAAQAAFAKRCECSFQVRRSLRSSSADSVLALRTDGAGHDSHDISHIILSAADRVPPSPAQLASITCPILILSGTDDKVVSPLVAAEEWKKAFKGAKGGATIASITGAPHLMSLSDFVSCSNPPNRRAAADPDFAFPVDRQPDDHAVHVQGAARRSLRGAASASSSALKGRTLESSRRSFGDATSASCYQLTDSTLLFNSICPFHRRLFATGRNWQA